MKSKPNSNISFPRGLVWTVEDWKDFYFTLAAFRRRVLERHGLDERGKRGRPQNDGTLVPSTD